MDLEIIINIIINIGLLIVIAQVLARFEKIKKYLVNDNHSYLDKIFMIIIFSSISILSTEIGYSVDGALANTRVIGVMAGGFIGGPIVGISTAIISGVHRYLIDIDGFTAIACCISTILEGCISALFYKEVKKSKYREFELYSITFIAEILQMIVILIFAKPFTEALDLVSKIAFPMVFINSIGLVLFIGVFKQIFIEQEYKFGEKISLAFDITKKCLPIINKGEYNSESCREISKIILKFSKEFGIIFTNKERIIYSKGRFNLDGYICLPTIAKKVLEKKEVLLSDQNKEYYIGLKKMPDMVAIGAPLIKNGQAFGCLIILTNKYKLSFAPDIKFIEGLSSFLSTQYELAEVEKQKILLQKAEFNALQSQINPHFIFNSLNTISAFCREKPNKARELLIDLASYFRSSIQNKDGLVDIYSEMDYVRAYLQLEKARFEERLDLEIQVPSNLNYKMPCLILQPIVENAVIHGAMKRKKGVVKIIVKEEKKNLKISIMDNGLGMPKEIIKTLKSEDENFKKGIGLRNVNKRLCYIYGENNGLDIVTSSEGTEVNIVIPIIKGMR